MSSKKVKVNFLRTLREREGLSQSELSDAAGVSRDTISRMENGEAVALNTIKKVATALGRKPNELLESGRVYGIIPDILGLEECKSATQGIRTMLTAPLVKLVEQSQSMQDNPDSPKPNSTHPIELEYVRDYWNSRELEEGDLVAIEGSLSLFAPMIIGPPQAKRDIHLWFRQVSANDRLMEATGFFDKSVLNACMSYSAGQMVWRLQLPWINFVYMGLYQGIVRNSIPVIVSEKYYKKHVAGLFDKQHPHVVDVRLVGRMKPLCALSTLFSGLKSKTGLPPRLVEHLESHHLGLFVDEEEGGSIEFLANTKYLDGDIWVAIRNDAEEELFVSRFLDLANPDDVSECNDAIRSEVHDNYPTSDIIFQWDQVEPLFHSAQMVTEEDVKNDIARYFRKE